MDDVAKRYLSLLTVLAFLFGMVTTDALAMGRRPEKKKSTYKSSTTPSKPAAAKTTMPSKPATRR
ncbi:MAG: hypothetical protein HY590_02285 [Candidatus Omnitrophica bacterium]|nr:hypothetical protein [Candidatus Omnitrophota bacterium]